MDPWIVYISTPHAPCPSRYLRQLRAIPKFLASENFELEFCLRDTAMNGIDRVFVSALNTVKRLPSSPSSPKPPLEDRLLLYGLFKQSMEGDVPESMLQTLQGEPADEEDDANREKTAAWADQRGTSKTEAKKLYITTLIRSMRQYGSKTETAKSLIDELDFVWNQVNDNNDEDSILHSRSNSGSHAQIAREAGFTEEGDDDEEEDQEGEELGRILPNVYKTAQNSPLKAMQPQRTGENPLLQPSSLLLGTHSRHGPTSTEDEKWRRHVELALQQIRTELASVKESLLLSGSSNKGNLFDRYGSNESLVSTLLSRIYKFLRVSLTVAIYDVVFLVVVWYGFRRRGDMRAKRVEDWVLRLYDWMLAKLSRFMKVRTGVRSIGDRR